MWNKKDEPVAPPNPRPATTAATAPAADGKKENTPVSTMAFKAPEPDVRSGQASIGKAVKINGQIFSKEDLYIDGDVEGTVELHENKLTIGPNGRVQASVRAREVVVLGAIQGNVEASDRIDIRKEAKLVGDIKTARIVIEDGAYFKGSIDIMKPEAKPVPVAAPPMAQAAGAPGGRPAGVPGTTNSTSTAEVKR
jgi:cytoskeletal protein CcmA (bactofilin family)